MAQPDSDAAPNLHELAAHARSSSKRVANAIRDFTRDVAILEESLETAGIGIKYIQETTTAREGEGDKP